MSLEEEELARALAEEKMYIQMAKDFIAVMDTLHGRRLIFALISKARVFMPVFSENALTMALAEGTRQQGLLLIDLINRECPERFAQMLTENSVQSEDRPQ